MKDKTGKFWDELETMPGEARKEYLDTRLAEATRHAYQHAPAARKIMDDAGVSPNQINTVKDLAKLPITRKTELIKLQRANPPYGGFLAIPPAEVDRIFLSPGPIYEPIQHAGIAWFAKSFWAAGFRKGDIVANTFTYHLSPAGILFHEALRDCGATAIPMGTGNTESQVITWHDLKVTGFVGTPSFLMTVIKRAEEMGYNFQQDFYVKRAWFTGEMLAPSLRKTFEETYDIHTTQAYAVTETGGALAYECSEKSGLHLMDEYIIEIVDPESGRQLGPGEVGEVVVTPIHNKAWGLIRFGTGDLSAYTTDICPCGRTAHKLTGIMGRTSDAVKIRGMFVVARQAEQVIRDFDQIDRFQFVVERIGQQDKLTLNIELAGETTNTDRLVNDVKARFQSLCRVKIDSVDCVTKGTIETTEPKIVDKRTWE